MKLITCEAIRQHNPCYDPATKLPENYSSSVLDFLVKETQFPPQDRIWVAVRFLSDKTNRLFAVDCARRALSRVRNPDPRSVAACDVAGRYAHGQATEEELRAAWAAAVVAEAVAWAARVEEWPAVAARAAARVAWAAARVAEWAAAAAEWAAGAAWAAGNREREMQISRLIELIKEWEGNQ